MTPGSLAQRRTERGAEWTLPLDSTRDGASDMGDLLGQHGLWRVVRSNGGLAKVFECPAYAQLVPPGVRSALDCDEDRLHTEVCDWAHATARGELRHDWVAPSADEVGAWVDLPRLQVRSGGHITRGELDCDPRRLRLSFPELVGLGQELPPARLAWAQELCLDTQTHWQLARFGIADGRVQAEVDLSGVPSPLAEPLLERALEALVFAVAWVLPALAVIADPGVGSATLNRRPAWCLDSRLTARTTHD